MMGVKFGVCLLYLFSCSVANGYSGAHYFSEDPVSFGGIDTNDAFYQINSIPQASDRAPDDPSDDYIPLLYVPSWKYPQSQNSEGYNSKKPSSNRKKRAISKRSPDDDVRKKFDGDVFPPDLDSVKTIHFSSLFTPRFGRKRNSLEPISNYVISNGKPGDASSLDLFKHPSTVYFDPKNGFRSGRLKSYHKKQLTPRLGRSSEQNRVQLTAGSAFTPRLGRSENPTDVHLLAGSAFTPRLGRSSNPKEIQLTAGSAFTPRLGRSENPREVRLTSGSAFTPRLGRSDIPTAVRLNAGRVFTPRFGRSEQQIQLNAGSAFTPRFGRSEDVDFGQMNSREVFE